MSAQSHFPKRKAGSFYPPQRTLMGPGPSDIHPRVLSAMGRPTIGYLDPVFVEMMEELKGLLRYAFQTKNALTFPVSGPGSVGMEMCFVNMINPGDKVVVCRNGVFGGRMIENVERCGGIAVVVEDTWGTPVDPNKVEDALRKNPDAKIVAFVHAETSTGVVSDAKSIADARARSRRHDHHGCGDVARRHTGARGRVGHRRRVLRQSEVPVVHAGPVADHLQRPRGRARARAQGEGPQLVHGPEPAARILGCDHAHLPPHRPHQFHLRAARSAAHAAGRRTGEQLGASRAKSQGAARRASRPSACSTWSRRSTGCRR